MYKTIYLAEGITGKQLQKALGIKRNPKPQESPTPRTQIRKRTLSQDSFLAQKIFKQLNP